MSAKKRELEKLDELKLQVEGLEGLKRLMAEDLLTAYVDVYDDYQELNVQLASDGLLIPVEKGAANNRRTEYVKHPAFDMRRNCISQMADLANKINRFVRESDGGEEEGADGLIAFNAL